jgi:hypothetical protein
VVVAVCSLPLPLYFRRLQFFLSVASSVLFGKRSGVLLCFFLLRTLPRLHLVSSLSLLDINILYIFDAHTPCGGGRAAALPWFILLLFLGCQVPRGLQPGCTHTDRRGCSRTLVLLRWCTIPVCTGSSAETYSEPWWCTHFVRTHGVPPPCLQPCPKLGAGINFSEIPTSNG